MQTAWAPRISCNRRGWVNAVIRGRFRNTIDPRKFKVRAGGVKHYGKTL